MDNVCHTLAGLALGESGLKRTGPLANATLMIGANLPDLDVLSYAWGPVTALGFRRGWTHGVLAMVVLPLVLAALMLATDRVLGRIRPLSHSPSLPQSFPSLLLLAAVSVWSHPLLDLLNTYGVRLLMPFSGAWFYGDTLFIVDVWVWAALGVGILASRWLNRRTDGPADRRTGRPAQVAVAMVVLYIGAMAASSRVIRAEVARELASSPTAPTRVMVGPVPLDPFHRSVVLEYADHYAIGSFRARGARLEQPLIRIPRGDSLPDARSAAATPAGRTFLTWARFPFFERGDSCIPGHVCIRDARYFPQTWAEVAVPVGGTVSFASPETPGTAP
jgi:inner membrane protein